GDMEKAVEILRTRGKNVADKKGGRETGEGRIAAYTDAAKAVGALLEMRCESAPVAKNDMFVKLANDLVRQAALNGVHSVEELLTQPFLDDPKKTVNDHVRDLVGLIRENMRPQRLVRLSGGLLGSYVHHDGSVGAMIQVEGTQADPQLLKEICMHITFKNPVALRREDVPQELVTKEREIAKSQAAATGKPAKIVENIAEGKMKTWFAENVLLEQPFIKDDSKLVGDLLKAAGLKAVKFVRLKVGEAS
ncbi:MAG: translation elongation factor Ts, partial [Planctomycetes bacterium]|nr:translation elongation factor Ts [Planctomycetota bacterium]